MQPIPNTPIFNLCYNYSELPGVTTAPNCPEQIKTEKPQKKEETKKSNETKSVTSAPQQMAMPAQVSTAPAGQDTTAILQSVFGFVSQILNQVFAIFGGLLGAGNTSPNQSSITAGAQGDKEGGFSLGNIFSGLGNAVGGLFGGDKASAASESKTKESSGGDILGTIGKVVGSFF